MIVFLIISGIILLLLAGVLFLPVSLHLKFKEDFFLKVKFAGIRVFEMKPQPEKEKKDNDENAGTVNDKKTENGVSEEIKGLWVFLRKKYGFKDAVKVILSFAGDVLSHIKRLLRHIKIKSVRLNITVCTEDAAKTAIDYGEVCAAAYPVLAFLSSFAKIGFKSININSDFNGGKPDFNFSAVVRMQIFYLLITAYKVYREYNKFILKENYNGRK